MLISVAQLILCSVRFKARHAVCTIPAFPPSAACRSGVRSRPRPPPASCLWHACSSSRPRARGKAAASAFRPSARPAVCRVDAGRAPRGCHVDAGESLGKRGDHLLRLPLHPARLHGPLRRASACLPPPRRAPALPRLAAAARPSPHPLHRGAVRLRLQVTPLPVVADAVHGG